MTRDDHPTPAARGRSMPTDPRCRGDVLVEYAIVVAATVLFSLGAIAILSGRIGGVVNLSATSAVPGAHPGDNGHIGSGPLIEIDYTNPAGSVLDTDQILMNSDGTISRLSQQFGVDPGDGAPFDDAIMSQMFD